MRRLSGKLGLPRRRRVPVLQQLSAVECGAACLAMILSYHGRETTVAECREKCSPGRGGLTARTIAEAARDYGMRVKAYSLEPSNFTHLSLPAVAHWEFNHFVVVERWTPHEVVIVDPGAGRRVLSAEEFDHGFTGVALTFEPGANFQRRPGPAGTPWLRYLKGMLRLPGSKGALAHVLAASLVLQLLGLVAPLMMKVLVDRVLPDRLSGAMAMLGLGVLLVVAAQALTGLLRASVLIHLRGRLDSHLMLDFFEHLLSLPFGFFQKRTSGDLLMRLGSNSVIREVLTNNTLSLFLDGSFVLFYLLILVLTAPTFAVLAVALGGLQVLIVFGTRGRMTHLMQRELAAKAEEQGYLVEAVSSVSMLKASGAEDRAMDRWSDLFSNQLNISLERSRLSALIETGLGTLRTLSPLLLLWVGAWRVIEGDMSLGTMLAVNALAASFLSPIIGLVTNGQQLMLVGAHLDRITDVLEAEPEQSLQEGGETLKLTGRIEVRDLSFRYEPHSPFVLRDVSFSVEPGQKVALVGPTGSGKSTLAMLLLGLFQPTHGDILYDHVPARKLNYRSLRAQMGVVMQEPFLFSGSILQNITLNDPDLPPERVAEAARLAAISPEIMQMPMGFETFVSERATTLSGGQRQRLALSRALAHGPAVLVLDEATSHLDTATEAAVDENLNGLRCTRIVIAHRLSTIRNADLILVLEEGRLVERGTHEELLALGGRYASLSSRQDVGGGNRHFEGVVADGETPAEVGELLN